MFLAFLLVLAIVLLPLVVVLIAAAHAAYVVLSVAMDAVSY